MVKIKNILADCMNFCQVSVLLQYWDIGRHDVTLLSGFCLFVFYHVA